MSDDGVKLVKQGAKYEGAQGVTYDAGVRHTAGAEKICMNVLPMPAGAKAKPFHRGIETMLICWKVSVRFFTAQHLNTRRWLSRANKYSFQPTFHTLQSE